MIDELESKIDAMLRKMRRLQEENRALAEQSESGGAALREENERLREELRQEKATKDAVLDRIDALLSKLREATGETPQD